MEENEKINAGDDFKDFGEELDFVAPNLDELEKNVEEKEEDIVVPEFEEETQSLEENDSAPESNENKEEDSVKDDNTAEDTEDTENSEEQKASDTQEETPTQEIKEDTKTEETPQEEELRLLKEKYEENSKNLDSWEELNAQNDIVKKYIVYVDKENISAIDELTVDERNRFLNSAIKLKFEHDDIKKERIRKKRLLLHSTVMICTIIIFMPIAIYLAHLSIVATFKNYKYSQDNFEKLYRESFSKSPTYIKAQKYAKKAEKNNNDNK